MTPVRLRGGREVRERERKREGDREWGRDRQTDRHDRKSHDSKIHDSKVPCPVRASPALLRYVLEQDTLIPA